MDKFTKPEELEVREKTKTHWEHPCQACKLEGSTTFTERGTQWKADVYSCADHSQPGIYGSEGKKLPDERVVVRYAAPTRDSMGEISFDKTKLNLEDLRSQAQKRQGGNSTFAEIAIGKVV